MLRGVGDREGVTTLAYRTETARAWYKLNDVAAGGSLRSISTVLADPANDDGIWLRHRNWRSAVGTL